VTSEETHGNLFYVVKNGRLNIPGIRELLEEILPGKTEVIDHQVDHVFPEIGHKSMVLNARQLAHKDGGEETKLILLAFEDRTGQPLKAAKYIQGEPLP
jgi:chemotaxis protein methyltransferase CheR